MLSNDDRAHLVNLAMQAEAECYNAYFMREATRILTDYANIHGAKVLWGFLINASPVTYRLYLEFCLLGSPALKENISFKVV